MTIVEGKYNVYAIAGMPEHWGKVCVTSNLHPSLVHGRTVTLFGENEY